MYLDTPLERKDKVKYLGVLFDEKMQWNYYQIRNITQNLKLSKIRSIASFLIQHTKKQWSCRISIIAPRLGLMLHLFD